MKKNCLWLLLFSISAFGQNPLYQFSIDQDRLTGAPDFSFLNHPLGPADRLFVKQGHFFAVGPDLLANTGDDERVRLFGANLAFGANFPTAEDSIRVAKRLRRLGMNLVRLHHMDSIPDSNPSTANSILTTQPYPALNQVSVARLRAFLQALKAEGIYANLNLHVGYQFRPSTDNIPALPNGQPIPDQSKPLHMIHPRMIDLQAKYTRDVLDALELGNDPVLGVVEVNNETSLLDAWQNGSLDQNLLGEYLTEFKGQWNSWLQRKYSSTDELRSAWGASEPDGPDLVQSINWSPLEIHSPAVATTGPDTSNPGTQWVNVSNGSAVVILKKVGFEVKAGTAYLAEVELKGDFPAGETGNLYWDIKRDISPWDTASARTLSISRDWAKFTMAVSPKADFPAGTGRFGLSVEGIVGRNCYIRNARFYKAGRKGLSDGESLPAANISVVTNGEIATDARLNDYLRFVAERDGYYLDRMKEAVREKAGPLVPITGTQMNFGGLMTIDSHGSLDYQDIHFYVDHYWFPGTPWDDRDWCLRDQTSVGSGLWDFHNLAWAREAGKPFTCSEFNQPWPNTYAAELDPLLAAFAAFQDWDSLMHFAYAHGRNWDGGVPDGFNINGDWTKFPVIGQSAWLFRSGAIRSGGEPLSIPLPQADRLKAQRDRWNGNFSEYFQTVFGYAPEWAFAKKVELVKDQDFPAPAFARSAPTKPILADTGELTFDSDRKFFLIHSPFAAGAVGFLGSQGKIAAGAVEVETGSSARGFASLVITSLDSRPIPFSGRILISNPGYTLPSKAGVMPATVQPLVNYKGNRDLWTLQPEDGSSKPSGRLSGGAQPNWYERVELAIAIQTQATAVTVYPLDGMGNRMTPLGPEDIQLSGGIVRIQLHSSAQVNAGTLSPWFELRASGIPERENRRSVLEAIDQVRNSGLTTKQQRQR